MPAILVSQVTEAEVLAMFDAIIARFDNPTPALAAALAEYRNPTPQPATDYDAIFADALDQHENLMEMARR
jgi:hypothetical protein